VPRLDLGRWLAGRAETVACIDLSDGIATDLGHLLAGTGLGARVEPAALPRPRGFQAACRSLGVDPESLIATGGEDYELLFALRPGPRGPDLASAAERLGVAIQRVGEVVRAPGIEGLPEAPAAHHF